MFPAPAGMSPLGLASSGTKKDVPRTRGDEPQMRKDLVVEAACSPHPRG